MLIANKPTDPSEMQGAIASHSCEKVVSYLSSVQLPELIVFSPMTNN
ncbi:MAG: hypothetical protein KME28_19925 [Pelatocladus maniniholoensis HA4357-MV3]|uniref:Uncharacterized protein n=1 Tax=Pelatocladus maniniholoensis HA4357-MV3 TaxID=1117104 RepID=A0A9E3HBY4_9NOST|nr:hypothetical protein [Pelatocladus maniniholoensis HA4357-MV3]